MIPCPPGLSYLPFQADAIRRMRATPNLYLADEMGVGKTITAIGRINDDARLCSILIVCPASLKINWARELAKWLARDLTVATAAGGTVPYADIVIINYDILERNKKALQARLWDLVICDESHMMSNPKAKRTKAVACLRRRYLLCLSGTPIRNRPMELWPVLAMLDSAAWGRMHAFGLEYCDAKQMDIPVPMNQLRKRWWSVTRVLTQEVTAQGRVRQGWLRRDDGFFVNQATGGVLSGGGMQGRKIVSAWATIWDYSGASKGDELQEKLFRTCMVRRLKRDVIKDLPAKVRQVIPLNVRMPLKLRKTLGMLEPQEGESYLTQVAALTVPECPSFEAVSLARAEVGMLKVKEVLDWLEITLSSVDKVIVFAYHHDVMDAICTGLMTSNPVQYDGRMSEGARQAAVDRFQADPACHVFIGQITAAGVGLTLTAASHVVFAELDWVPANVTQAEDRAHRIGQTETVNIYHLVADDSLDARIAYAIVAKQKVSDRILGDALATTKTTGEK